MTPEDIKVLRKEMEITQREFAELVGVSVHAVRKWEQGQRSVKGAALKNISMLSCKTFKR